MLPKWSVHSQMRDFKFLSTLSMAIDRLRCLPIFCSTDYLCHWACCRLFQFLLLPLCSSVFVTNFIVMLSRVFATVFWFRNCSQCLAVNCVMHLWTENGIERHRVLGTRICYEPSHANYTRGIEIQQVSLSGTCPFESLNSHRRIWWCYYYD